MKKYDNFVKAFQNLQDIYLYGPPYGNVEGKTGSPKMILKTAY